MNKKTLLKWIFFLVTGCCACNNHSSSHSSGILPLDSVAVIVVDCYFLESEIYVKQSTDDMDMKDYTLSKYDSLFYKHKLTKELFMKNVRYYFTHKKYANIIMNKVDEIIEQRVTALRDSLNME